MHQPLYSLTTMELSMYIVIFMQFALSFVLRIDFILLFILYACMACSVIQHFESQVSLLKSDIVYV